MKKFLPIYVTLIATLFIASSCMDDDDNNTIIYPYSALKSFSIGNIRAYYNDVTNEGKDTVLKATVIGANYPFIIDQKNRMVYNSDSLPVGSDISKVTVGVSCDGIAYFYVDSTNTYETFSSSDSLDFTKPRRLLIASSDGSTASEYTVQLNVHKVYPEQMYWKAVSSPLMYAPKRAIATENTLKLFGLNTDGSAVLSERPINETGEWNTPETISIPQSANIEEIQHFNGIFYVTADGKLYTSEDGKNWAATSSAGNFTKLLSSSDKENKIWAIKNDSIAYSADGIDFITVCAVPDGFPLHNISSTVYPLATNPEIIRTVLIGYPDDANESNPTVWSRLSTEQGWVQYSSSGSKEFDCPSLRPLSVLRYDGSLYAFGGEGNVNGTNIKAFESLFVSQDNGLTWFVNDKKLFKLPAELLGSTAPYTSVVDNDNHLWIISGGDTPSTWQGRINRLSF